MTRGEGLHRARLRVGAWLHRQWPMVVLTVVVWWLAVLHHHRGISWGDDFSLYLRQARSVIDGNIGEVIADNRFNVLNAANRASAPSPTRGAGRSCSPAR